MIISKLEFGLPPYIFFACLGAIVSISTNVVLLYLKKCNFQRCFKLLLWVFPFVLIFAKAFGVLSGLYNAIGNGKMITFEIIRETGIVFYGGLFGLLLAYYLATSKAKNSKQELDILAVSIPQFHVFGRIGCYFSGCCYGKEYAGPCAVFYTTVIDGLESTTYRVPIQLFESLYNLFIFIYLLILCLKKDWSSKHILSRYLILYSIGRFFLEYFRGDEKRGLVNGVSFSQLISLIVFIVVTRKIYTKRKRKKSC